jgi:hypothetical protein
MVHVALEPSGDLFTVSMADTGEDSAFERPSELRFTRLDPAGKTRFERRFGPDVWADGIARDGAGAS